MMRARYERIHANNIGHLLAVMPEFGLKVFKNPSGNDVRMTAGRLNSGA